MATSSQLTKKEQISNVHIAGRLQDHSKSRRGAGRSYEYIRKNVSKTREGEILKLTVLFPEHLHCSYITAVDHFDHHHHRLAPGFIIKSADIKEREPDYSSESTNPRCHLHPLNQAITAISSCQAAAAATAAGSILCCITSWTLWMGSLCSSC